MEIKKKKKFNEKKQQKKKTVPYLSYLGISVKLPVRTQTTPANQKPGCSDVG